MLLGIDRVGVHDSFFELGGDSLLAVQLIARFEEQLGIKLQLQDIVESQTVATQAAFVDRQAEPSASREGILSLTQGGGGDARPLFLIHPAGGTVLCYLDLARLLGPDQPVYAVQSPSMYDQAEAISVEHAAALYLDQIRSIQAHGPYRLGGLSYGGNVAFEMSRLLHAHGEQVDLLAMFDSHPPAAYGVQRSDDISLLRAFPSVLRQYVDKPVRISRARLERLSPERRLDLVVRQVRNANFLPIELAADDVRTLYEAWKIHLLAVQAYRPAPLAHPQPVTLYHAERPEARAVLSLLGMALPRGIEAPAGSRSRPAN